MAFLCDVILCTKLNQKRGMSFLCTRRRAVMAEVDFKVSGLRR